MNDPAGPDQFEGTLQFVHLWGTGSSNGTSIWTVKDDRYAIYSDFNGTNYGSAVKGSTAALGTDRVNIGIEAGKEWMYVQGASAPNRDEKFIIGITRAKRITAMKFNGTSWDLAHPTTGGTYLDDGLSGISSVDFNNAIVGYESQSGRAMLVWNNGKNSPMSLYPNTPFGKAQAGRRI